MTCFYCQRTITGRAPRIWRVGSETRHICDSDQQACAELYRAQRRALVSA